MLILMSVSETFLDKQSYIKEFIHGDMGRTHPNLGSLLDCDADILQLDVTNIDLDFPPHKTMQTAAPIIYAAEIDVELKPPTLFDTVMSNDAETFDETG